MEGRLRFFDLVPLWLLPLALALALALYPLGPSKSLGLLYGLGLGLVDLRLMIAGLVRIYNRSWGRSKGAVQFAVTQSYLARYLLLGFLLWLSLRLDGIDFFAAAGGAILPRLAIWGRGAWGGLRDE